jgi:hypothetical protein
MPKRKGVLALKVLCLVFVPGPNPPPPPPLEAAHLEDNGTLASHLAAVEVGCSLRSAADGGVHQLAEERHAAKGAFALAGPGAGRDAAALLDGILRSWMEVAWLAVHWSCTKRSRPAVFCEFCLLPLLPLTCGVRGGPTVATHRPCS